MNLFFHKTVRKKLIQLEKKEYKNFLLVQKGLDDLELNGFNAQHIKPVKNNKKGIYRKRVGKWRILFTEDGFILRIWIVDRKKGPRDYEKWVEFIIKNI